jgi:hypothetical protein
MGVGAAGGGEEAVRMTAPETLPSCPFLVHPVARFRKQRLVVKEYVQR